MSTPGERKCALLLVSLRKRDRRKLLSQLPAASARAVGALIRQLEALPFPVEALADDLLADEVRGLTARTSLELEQLVDLSRRVPAAWFARILSVWTGMDRNFCLAVLDAKVGTDVRRELAVMPELPSRLVEAIKAEAVAMATASTTRKAA